MPGFLDVLANMFGGNIQAPSVGVPAPGTPLPPTRMDTLGENGGTAMTATPASVGRPATGNVLARLRRRGNSSGLGPLTISKGAGKGPAFAEGMAQGLANAQKADAEAAKQDRLDSAERQKLLDKQYERWRQQAQDAFGVRKFEADQAYRQEQLKIQREKTGAPAKGEDPLTRRKKINDLISSDSEVQRIDTQLENDEKAFGSAKMKPEDRKALEAARAARVKAIRDEFAATPAAEGATAKPVPPPEPDTSPTARRLPNGKSRVYDPATGRTGLEEVTGNAPAPGQPAPAAPAAPAPAAPGADIPLINTPDEARQLPSGSQFRTPDGRVFEVP